MATETTNAERTAKLLAGIRAYLAAGNSIFARDAATTLVRITRRKEPDEVANE